MANQLPHTAIPTWSGFIYQGRVGLYHILKQLNIKTENEINELLFQIDSIEDFTILESNASSVYTPISMHQVKAVKSTLYSTYKADFEQLAKKWTDINLQTVEAFFHLATQNEKTKTQIETLHPKIKIYEYENNAESCSLNDIDTKIKEQIILVLQKYGIEGHNNANNVQLLSEILEKIVSDKVIYIHSLNHGGIGIRIAALDNPIPLGNFLNAVRTDISSLIQDEVYFEGRIRADLNRYYQEFCVEIDYEEITEIVKEKMEKYLLHFNGLDAINFKIFLQKIRPHQKICFSTLSEYHDGSLIESEIKEAFLIILSEIIEPTGDEALGWVDAELKNYFPTAIKASNTEKSRINISNKIIKTASSTMVEVPFDFDFLITDECNVDSITYTANKINEVEQLDADKITNWRKIALIDIETAKQKLNG